MIDPVRRTGFLLSSSTTFGLIASAFIGGAAIADVDGDAPVDQDQAGSSEATPLFEYMAVEVAAYGSALMHWNGGQVGDAYDFTAQQGVNWGTPVVGVHTGLSLIHISEPTRPY